MSWKIIARHRVAAGTVITESVQDDEFFTPRRYTATIRGYQNWRLVQSNGHIVVNPLLKAMQKAIAIRDRIDSGDTTIFDEPNTWDAIEEETR